MKTLYRAFRAFTGVWVRSRTTSHCKKYVKRKLRWLAEKIRAPFRNDLVKQDVSHTPAETLPVAHSETIQRSAEKLRLRVLGTDGYPHRLSPTILRRANRPKSRIGPMHEEKKWRLAVSQFHAIRSNVPGYIKESLVDEFHAILDQMAAASGEDFSSFRIPAADVKPRVVSFQMGRQGSQRYSKDNYCDSNLFDRKVQALFNYLPEVERSMSNPKPASPTDYDSLTTEQLERLAHDHNIDGYGDARGNVDRGIIISRLRARDRAMKGDAPAVHHHTHVGSMIGSVLQQGATGSPVTIHMNTADLQDLVDKIRAALPSLQIDAAAKQEADSDLRTIEPQLVSPNPKKTIIGSCLQSLQTIVVGAATTAMTTELAAQIEHALKSLGF